MIYCMLFSLFKGIIIKKEGTHSWQESVSSFQNTFQRKYPNVMIRILNLFCKLKNIKLSDQEWFDRAIAKLNLLEQVCPYCDSKGQMIFHDSYPRYMITLKANHIETEILRIPRVKCDSCGHTHAVLPEMLIPYSSYSIRFVLTVLKDYFLHAHTVEKICEMYQIAHSTFYAFRDLFFSHKKLILGALNDAQKKTSDFIEETDGQLLFQFWKSFRLSFLQTYHASDFHHL
ncbi:DUF6431 domain-containing protein [Dorea amylophila]|nr:DUF6431 domain-containing protein [Dorea amylophila]